MTTCANCERSIGNLETSHTWQENTICYDCFLRLSQAAQQTAPVKDRSFFSSPEATVTSDAITIRGATYPPQAITSITCSLDDARPNSDLWELPMGGCIVIACCAITGLLVPGIWVRAASVLTILACGAAFWALGRKRRAKRLDSMRRYHVMIRTNERHEETVTLLSSEEADNLAEAIQSACTRSGNRIPHPPAIVRPATPLMSSSCPNRDSTQTYCSTNRFWPAH